MKNTNSPKVSVIVPCYNMGKYIDETIDSVLNQTYQDFEIIIVNDGSTDSFTNQKLENFDKPKTTILTIQNKGLGGARNYGIENALGEYILPLDADDIIYPDYLEKAVNVIENNAIVRIVYCKAEFFEAKSGLWDLPDYNFPLILEQNLIFCTALYRKSDFLKTKGYSTKMSYMGWEDWNFWLSLIELSKPEYYNNAAFRIPEVLFKYRIRENSMIQNLNEDKDNTLRKEVFMDHIELYASYFKNPITLNYELKNIKREYDKLLRNYNGILGSRTYKLGNMFTFPFKKLLR
jgi:glycosyltransferase involved in cell wall biosynthesis